MYFDKGAFASSSECKETRYEQSQPQTEEGFGMEHGKLFCITDQAIYAIVSEFDIFSSSLVLYSRLLLYVPE